MSSDDVEKSDDSDVDTSKFFKTPTKGPRKVKSRSKYGMIDSDEDLYRTAQARREERVKRDKATHELDFNYVIKTYTDEQIDAMSLDKKMATIIRNFSK